MTSTGTLQSPNACIRSRELMGDGRTGSSEDSLLILRDASAESKVALSFHRPAMRTKAVHRVASLPLPHMM